MFQVTAREAVGTLRPPAVLHLPAPSSPGVSELPLVREIAVRSACFSDGPVAWTLLPGERAQGYRGRRKLTLLQQPVS